MHLATTPAILLVILWSASALAKSNPPRRSCGVRISQENVVAAERLFQARRVAPEREDATAVIDLFFHIVYANKTALGGWVQPYQILEQVKVINDDFRAVGLSWKLKNATWIENEIWFNKMSDESPYDIEMKRIHRQGGAEALNVYTVGFHQGDAQSVLGYATFPMDYATEGKRDGIVLLHTTMPRVHDAILAEETEGRDSVDDNPPDEDPDIQKRMDQPGPPRHPYTKGRTLVHEAGHWLGLYHTFQGGCGGAGDQVNDTPPEESPAHGCPVGRDTCPGAGTDPIFNFMDYTDDDCMDRFTKGQIQRMRAQLSTYRGVKFSPPTRKG